MADKRQCAGTIINPKNAKFGERCSRFAKRGSEYCNLHGGNHVRGVGHPETLERRCIARRKNGRQCAKPPIAGGVVCGTHGGRSPFVLAKAQARLASFADPALTVLYDLLVKPGTSDSDRGRYALAILDRTGLSPTSRMEIGVESKPWEITMNHIIKDVPEGMVPILSIPQPTIEDIQDAEVVEDEPVHPRELLPQIIPPMSSNERATIRIGSPLDRPKRRQSDEFEG
jgi:hypothetical protein